MLRENVHAKPARRLDFWPTRGVTIREKCDEGRIERDRREGADHQPHRRPVERRGDDANTGRIMAEDPPEFHGVDHFVYACPRRSRTPAPKGNSSSSPSITAKPVHGGPSPSAGGRRIVLEDKSSR